MEQEIELKIMVWPDNIALLRQWLNTLSPKPAQSIQLGNTYFDTPDGYFAQQKMGLRIRAYNQHYEMTLKTAGDIVGGLHIRPEYNLPLSENSLDFPRLTQHFNLPFPNAELIQQALSPTFSTDFQRTLWHVPFQDAEIEVALDQGIVKNPFGQENICEFEFELKRGKLPALLQFLEQMPKEQGMWLSSLSKAQRGYLVGNPEALVQAYRPLFAHADKPLNAMAHYQLTQQIADFIRLSPQDELIALYTRLAPTLSATTLTDYLISPDHLKENLAFLAQAYRT